MAVRYPPAGGGGWQRVPRIVCGLVAELVDAHDSKSCTQKACGFDSHPGHQTSTGRARLPPSLNLIRNRSLAFSDIDIASEDKAKSCRFAPAFAGRPESLGRPRPAPPKSQINSLPIIGDFWLSERKTLDKRAILEYVKNKTET